MNEHLLLVLELLKPWLQTNAPVHNMQDMVTTKKDCDIKCNIHPTQKLAASVQTLPLLAVELYTPKLLSVLRKKAIYEKKISFSYSRSADEYPGKASKTP